MKIRVINILVAAMLFISVSSVIQGCMQPKAMMNTAFSDEFNQDDINFDIWEHSHSWGPWSWSEDNVYQKDGVLHIRMSYEPHTRSGNELFYKSGILRSRGAVTYGYFEARIKGNHTFPGTCPAFWLVSDKMDMVRGVDTLTYSEIDIVEMLQMNWSDIKEGASGVNTIDCNLHMRMMENGKEIWKRPNGYPELCKGAWNAPWDPRDDFHVYGVENRPDSIIWYVDNKRVVAKENLYWHLPMDVILSMGLRHPHVKYVNGDRLPVPEEATADGFPTEMLIDWVRVWDKKYF